MRALASHQYGPGSIPGGGVIRGLSVWLVLVLAFGPTWVGKVDLQPTKAQGHHGFQVFTYALQITD